MSNIKNNTTALQNLLDEINNLPEASTGVELPSLTNEGTAADLLQGKELIDGDGNVVTGIFTIDDELNTQDDLIGQIQTALVGKASAVPTLQDKTITPTTETQTVTADNGYDGLDTVVVNAIPNAYVKPTTTKGETTYTPSTTNQTISAGTYCSGIQTIAGDANLVPENIAEGVSIFGVSGSHSGGSGSGGSGVDTCTLSFSGANPSFNFEIFYTTYENGAIVSTRISLDEPIPITIDNIVCNSMLIVYQNSINYSFVPQSGCETMEGMIYAPTFLYRITATNGQTANFTIVYNDF